MSIDRRQHKRRSSESGATGRGALPGTPRFYTNPAIVQRLDLIRHLAESSDLIPLCADAAGTGKTTLLFQLEAAAPDHWALCRVAANPLLDPDQLVLQMARCFGVAPGRPDLREALQQALENLRAQARHPVLIVDDAEQLSAATLSMLFELHARRSDGMPVFAAVLFADGSIWARLRSPGLAEAVARQCHPLTMPRLNPVELRDYAAFLLAQRGARHSQALAPRVISQWYRDSGGIPGRVNACTARMLRARTPRAWTLARLRRSIRLSGLRLAALSRWLPGAGRPGSWLPIAGLAAILVLGLSLQRQINALFEPPEIPAVAAPSSPAPAVDPKRATAETRAPSIEPLRLPAAAPSATTEAPPANSRTRLSTPWSRIEPTASGNPPTPRGALADRPPPESAPATEPAKPPLPVAHPPPEIQHGRDAPASLPNPANKAVPNLAFSDQGLKKEAWLLSRKPGSYTVQLMGVGDETTLKRFIQRHDLGGKAVYFEARRRGHPWFSLLYGVYSGRQGALRARAGLPPELKKADPWVRSLASVQKEIRTRRPR